MVRPERFELPAFWFVARRSIQLSYGRTRLVSSETLHRLSGNRGWCNDRVSGNGRRLGGCRWENQGQLLRDLQAGLANELSDCGGVKARCVVFDAKSACRAVKGEAANAVDLFGVRESEGNSLSGLRDIAIEDFDLGHRRMIARSENSDIRLAVSGIEAVDFEVTGSRAGHPHGYRFLRKVRTSGLDQSCGPMNLRRIKPFRSMM